MHPVETEGQTELAYFPGTQTVHAGHSVLLVLVHTELVYWAAPQTVHAVHSLLLVTVHTELAYWAAPQTWQLVHTVLPVLDVYVPAAQDEQTVTPVPLA